MYSQPIHYPFRRICINTVPCRIFIWVFLLWKQRIIPCHQDYPWSPAWTGDQMSVSYACALKMKQLNHISIKGNDQYGGTAGEHDV